MNPWRRHAVQMRHELVRHAAAHLLAKGLRSPSSIQGCCNRAAAASTSHSRQAAGADQRLAADVVRLGDAEQVDGSGSLFRRAATAEGDASAPSSTSRPGFTPTLMSRPSIFAVDGAIGRAAGQPRLDQAEGHAVDGDVHAAPFLGQAPGSCPSIAGLGGRVVGLTDIAEHRPAIDEMLTILRTLRTASVGLGLGLGQRTDHRLGCAQDAEGRGQVARP